jgi:hypothetical protein
MREEWTEALAAQRRESANQRTDKLRAEAKFESDEKVLHALNQQKREAEDKNQELQKARKALLDDQNALKNAILEEDETIGRAEEETQREKERNSRLQTEKMVLDHQLAGVRYGCDVYLLAAAATTVPHNAG